LRNLFGATQLNVERELEDLYSTFLAQLPIKMTAEEARKDLKDAIEACKEQAIGKAQLYGLTMSAI
jgi:hypothetical protein